MSVCKECNWSGHPDEIEYEKDGKYYHVMDAIDENGKVMDGFIKACPMCGSDDLT